MLRLLKIRDFALLEDVTIEFDKGLTVITGETGVGKSMIVGAIATLCGNRMDEMIIRSNKNIAEITGIFDIDEKTKARLAKSGIEVNGELIIRRRIERGKRQSTYVNDQIVSLNLVKEITEDIIDLIGQYENQSLFHTQNHRALLDSYAGVENIKKEYAQNYDELRKLQNKLDMLIESMRKKDEKIDFLKFQIEEIEKASLKQGEEQCLTEEKNLLMSSEKRSHLATEITSYLYDAEGAVEEQLGKVQKLLDELVALDPALKTLFEQINSSVAVIDEVHREITSYASTIEFSQERLDFVMEKLDIIRKLKKKYGTTITDIQNKLALFKQELANIEIQDEEVKQTKKRITAIEHTVKELADTLSKRRKRAAASLKEKILELLMHLGMKKARFEINITDKDLTETGKDEVEFYISTNPGENLKPLRTVASGGEISRIMLSLKTILSDVDHIPTIIFDEVDIGIGGRIAEAVGDLLSKVSTQHQIICVTHLPQISIYAHNHLLVEKEVEGKQTSSKIMKLDEQKRKMEIARMLGGKEITKKTVEHAEEFLKKGQQVKSMENQ
jgi:DNA repair protein RecN (Recombination protein N)